MKLTSPFPTKMASGTVRVALLLMALFVVILGCQATAPTINKAAKLKEMPPDELPERLMPMGRGKGGKGRDKLPLTVTEVNEGNIEQILRRSARRSPAATSSFS